MITLVDYLIARALPLPPLTAGRLFEYVLAANGVFVRGQRDGLEVLLPVARFESDHAVRGLVALAPAARLLYPRVPAHLLVEMVRRARGARDEQGQRVEMLFYLDHDARGWTVVVPEQTQTELRVRPVNSYDALHARAVIQVHSHHDFEPVFSAVDDRDHTGFQIYAVLGNFLAQPTLRVRAGLYGYWLEVPAWDIFEPVAGVCDAHA